MVNRADLGLWLFSAGRDGPWLLDVPGLFPEMSG
jgi:hypothetical protein